MRRFVFFFSAVILALSAVMTCAETAENRDSCEHQWVQVSITPATCTEDGEEILQCERCGKTDTRKLKALGHEWGYCKIIKRPTCTEDGLTRCFCTRDESHHEDKVMPALGHDWGDWVRIRIPTLTQPGLEQHRCRRCDDVSQRRIPALAQREEYALKLFAVPGQEPVSRSGEDGGYVLTFDCTLLNTGEKDLRVRSWTSENEGEPQLLEKELLLSAGQWVTIPVVRKVMEQEDHPDVIQSEICFFGENENGEAVCVSDQAVLSTRLSSDPDDSPPVLEISLTVGSAPEDPAGYQEGETVRYTVSVTNTGDRSIAGAVLQRLGQEDTEIVADLLPAETRTLSFEYEITLQNAADGWLALQCDIREDETGSTCIYSPVLILPVSVKD